MLKRVGERRRSCLTPTVVLNLSPVMLFICTAYSFAIEVLIGFALNSYFRKVDHEFACHTLSNDFLTSMKLGTDLADFEVTFTQNSEVEDLSYGVSSGSDPS